MRVIIKVKPGGRETKTTSQKISYGELQSPMIIKSFIFQIVINDYHYLKNIDYIRFRDCKYSFNVVLELLWIPYSFMNEGRNVCVMHFPYILPSETSVHSLPFTDTHSQYIEYGKRKLCRRAPSPVGQGTILAERVEGASSFPKFTL